MKKTILILFLSIALVFLVINYAYMDNGVKWEEEWPNAIKIGTSTIGGGFYMGGSAIANVLAKVYPKLDVTVEETKASVHNIQLMENDSIDLGMATTDTTWEAWNGKGDFEGKEYRNFRILMPAWSAPYLWATLEKYSDINSVRDFAGKKIVPVRKGSATDVFARKVLETLNIDAEVLNIASADAVQSLKIGTIQGFVQAHPSTAMQDLAMTIPTKMLGLSGKDAEIFIKEHPEFNYPLTVPAGYYKGQDEELNTVGMYDLIIVRADLPEDLVYAIVKAVYENADIVKDTWPIMAKEMQPEYLKVLGVPLHPGSVKYYKEIGVEIPQKLIY